MGPRCAGRCKPSSCPVKKSLVATERDEKQRHQFRKLVKVLDLRHCIFVDEMGSNLALTRRYGRAAPGARVHDSVPGDQGGNVSTIGAIDLKGVRTGLSVPGAIDGETMVFFVEELLAPTLKRGDLVFMDNCPIHKMDELEDLIDARGAGVVFLPSYSPDLNPIEHCWAKVKARLRALKPRIVQSQHFYANVYRERLAAAFGFHPSARCEVMG